MLCGLKLRAEKMIQLNDLMFVCFLLVQLNNLMMFSGVNFLSHNVHFNIDTNGNSKSNPMKTQKTLLKVQSYVPMKL
jgi:hypothetical protein